MPLSVAASHSRQPHNAPQSSPGFCDVSAELSSILKKNLAKFAWRHLFGFAPPTPPALIVAPIISGRGQLFQERKDTAEMTEGDVA
jgi:hypothetical protein